MVVGWQEGKEQINIVPNLATQVSIISQKSAGVFFGISPKCSYSGMMTRFCAETGGQRAAPPRCYMML
jgi:hypothetical protein